MIGSKYKNIDLDGKVYIVTGCNTGIGYETAAALVSMNATVVMACRSISKATAAREQILREVKCAPTKVRHDLWCSLGHIDYVSFVSCM